MDPTSLPEDILILILELLGVNELLALSLACRTMHTIVSYLILHFCLFFRLQSLLRLGNNIWMAGLPTHSSSSILQPCKG
jgi:hypothetical protein